MTVGWLYLSGILKEQHLCSWQVSGWEPRVSSVLSFLPSVHPAKITTLGSSTQVWCKPGNAPRRRTHTQRKSLLAAPKSLLPHDCCGMVMRT